MIIADTLPRRDGWALCPTLRNAENIDLLSRTIVLLQRLPRRSTNNGNNGVAAQQEVITLDNVVLCAFCSFKMEHPLLHLAFRGKLLLFCVLCSRLSGDVAFTLITRTPLTNVCFIPKRAQDVHDYLEITLLPPL